MGLCRRALLFPQGAEKPAARPTAFKPVLPRSGAILHSSPENGGHLPQQLHPPDKGKEQELKPMPCSGGLSDSGRNSMSSLPTHSTSSSYQLDPLVAPLGPISRFGGSAHNIMQCAVIQDSNMMSLKAMSFSDGGNKILNPGKAPNHHAAEKTTCIRSPISTDESTIQELEQKLLEREGELQELQLSFEEKEISSCQAYEEKQRRCKEELEGLKQKCNSKLKQTSQKTQRTQQVLHLQVFQLQQEKKQLREELENLMKEQNLLETKLRSYEKEKTSFAPALEETQWEVSGTRTGPKAKGARGRRWLHHQQQTSSNFPIGKLGAEQCRGGVQPAHALSIPRRWIFKPRRAPVCHLVAHCPFNPSALHIV